MFIGEIKGFSPGIIYIATQPDMYHAELTYLNKGLKRLKKVCESRGIKTVSLPKIGAGLDKLDWNSEVKPLLESILSDCETVFNVYEDYKIEYKIQLTTYTCPAQWRQAENHYQHKTLIQKRMLIMK